MKHSIREEVLERDNWCCQYCTGRSGDSRLHADHLIPKALRRRHRLRDDDPAYLVAACASCNLHKSTFHLVPENRAFMIPILPGTGWRTWDGTLPIPELPRR